MLTTPPSILKRHKPKNVLVNSTVVEENSKDNDYMKTSSIIKHHYIKKHKKLEGSNMTLTEDNTIVNNKSQIGRAHV